MRSATGKYRLEGDSAEFFSAKTISLIARGSLIIGRFGKTGGIRGTLMDHFAEAAWRDAKRNGWITFWFAPDFGSCRCEYGAAGLEAKRTSTFCRISRAKRPTLKDAAAE